MRKVNNTRAKKLVRWHNSYVVFLTPEIKALGWNERTIVKVSILKDEKKIVIEKGMEI